MDIEGKVIGFLILLFIGGMIYLSADKWWTEYGVSKKIGTILSK